jgi:transcription elongation factor S-II
LFAAIYKETRDTGMKYRNRIRSRVANLKDSKNPNLRINVLLGIITPERLAVLTAEVCFYLFFVYKSFLSI